MRLVTLPKDVFVPLLAVMILAYKVIAQTVVQLPAAKDNTLYENATGSLSNGAGQHFFAGVTREEFRRRALVFFDVAATIPTGVKIDSVKLTLYVSQTVAAAKSTKLHRVLKDWGEGATDAVGQEGSGGAATPGSATWIHTFYDTGRWQNPGGDFAAIASDSEAVGAIGFYTWGHSAEMAADVQFWLDKPDSNFGWIFLGDESAPSTAKRFQSRENAVEAQRPVLTVTYTNNTFVKEQKAVPALFALEQNYPNPFNPVTIIRYTLRQPGQVQLKVFTMTGRLIKTLEYGFNSSGQQQIQWNGVDDSGKPVPSGVYIYELEFADYRDSQKMLLVR